MPNARDTAPSTGNRVRTPPTPGGEGRGARGEQPRAERRQGGKTTRDAKPKKGVEQNKTEKPGGQSK